MYVKLFSASPRLLADRQFSNECRSAFCVTRVDST